MTAITPRDGGRRQLHNSDAAQLKCHREQHVLLVIIASGKT